MCSKTESAIFVLDRRRLYRIFTDFSNWLGTANFHLRVQAGEHQHWTNAIMMTANLAFLLFYSSCDKWFLRTWHSHKRPKSYQSLFYVHVFCFYLKKKTGIGLNRWFAELRVCIVWCYELLVKRCQQKKSICSLQKIRKSRLLKN